MENLATKDLFLKVLWEETETPGIFEYKKGDLFIDGIPATIEEENHVAKLMLKGLKIKQEVTTVGSSKGPFVTYDLDSLSFSEIQALIN